jgi:hypothetical protein
MTTILPSSSSEKQSIDPIGTLASAPNEIDFQAGDEALQLVGHERQTQFSDEYNLKLRSKLVISTDLSQCYAHLLSVKGLVDPTALWGCVLHSIFV